MLQPCESLAGGTRRWSGANTLPCHYTSYLTVLCGALRYYVKVYSALAAASTLVMGVRSLMLVKGSINAAQSIHRKALRAILRAPCGFFDTSIQVIAC